MFGRSWSLFLIALISLACSTSPPPEKPRTQAPPAPPARRTLDRAVVAKIESELVAIPGGRTIAPFRLARHEVTRGEWSAVMGQSPPDAEEGNADLRVNAGGNFVENLVGQNCSTTAWLAATGTESYTGFRLAANALSGQPAAHRPPIKKRKKS